MTDYGVTDDGFVSKDYSAIRESMQTRARAQFGDEIDLSENSFAGQLLDVVAYELATNWQILESVYYAGYLNTATKSNLDAVAVIQGIARKPAVAAEGVARFSRTSSATQDYVIPAGTRISNSDGTLVFETIAIGTLAINTTHVDIAVRCTEAGIVGNVASGILTHILDQVIGIESVTNQNPMTGGTDAETDAMLRLRTRVPTTASKATLIALQQAISAVTGVTAVLITEDTDHHTVTCYVLGGEDSEINAAIAATRPCGIIASLARPDPVPVSVTATVLKSTSITEAEAEANILDALSTFFGNLEISEDIAYSDILRVVANAAGVENVNALTATDGTTVLDALGESLSIADNSIATSGTHNLTVI
ncbi:baseplate J/gp47 family protein [Methanoregula sp.]|uniref:baseplate J/gp47 family protein n=1 Tax=Methanoregula sp. TaxID=2052170 RepID=UPI000CC6A2E6|nr:baseplate J/gp47 family protein [Methanoregula sp.]PKG31666.1 MAG: hypothetical protein CW742_12200 [Methanoregula sp.]